MKLGKEKEGHFSTALSFFFVLHFFFQESFGNSTSTLKSNSVFHRFLIVASWSFSHRQLFFFIVCWSLWWRSDSRFIVIVIKTWNLSPLPNSFSRKPKSSQLCQNGPPYFMYKTSTFSKDSQSLKVFLLAVLWFLRFLQIFISTHRTTLIFLTTHSLILGEYFRYL